MAKPWRVTDPKRATATSWFLNDAFSDYIASRVLFLSQSPKQAALLCSTAIEKCVKALLAIKGNVSSGHLKRAHWNVLQNDKDIRNVIAKEFFELNRRAYRLRYSDDLPMHFNLVIASREFLAEMDSALLTILSCFSVERNAKRRRTGYEAAINNRDERLLAENHILSGTPKKAFIRAKPQVIYEIRRDSVRGLFEMTYVSDKPAKVQGFLRPALVAVDSTGHDLSHYPTPGTVSVFADGQELIGS